MKTRTFLILVAVFFGLSLLACTVSLGNHWPGRVDVNFAVSFTILAVGGLMALVSLFVLVKRGLNSQSLDQSLPLLITLLGGILLYQVNWGVALALGLIGTAIVLTQRWGRRTGSREE